LSPRRDAARPAALATAPGGAYPPLLEQAANLAGAVGRVVSAATRGETIAVPIYVLETRRAT
jgi:hypothetical protein